MKKSITLLMAFIVFTVSALPSLAASAGKVVTQSTNLNVRDDASTSGSVVSSLPKGTYITLEEKSGSWWRVRYGSNSYGYSSAAYISEAGGSEKKVTTASGNLNVRTGAGLMFDIKNTLPKGTLVIVLSESGGWSYILYSGTKTGYVSSRYLDGEQSSSVSEEGSGSVKLSVPLYSQTDSRWRYDYLGYSSKTIGSSGCTTCCLAMCESYLRGYNVYPDDMESELSYSSGGDLYWPSGYTAYYGSDYLNKILSSLKNGKPVLVGAKTASGGQHWVIVTGFTGGDVVSSNFTVNDPGAYSRKTLSSFLDAFPYFYKIMLKS